MATERQIAANQMNALRSTGPVTEEGKRRSSRNAMKHGLLSEDMLIPGEDAKAFVEMTDALQERLEPEGWMEEALVDRIAGCLWRMRRAHRIEGSLFRHWLDQVMSDREDRQAWDTREYPEDTALAVAFSRGMMELDRFTRYEASIERGMFRALRELQRLQADRGARPAPPAVVEVDVSVNQEGA